MKNDHRNHPALTAYVSLLLEWNRGMNLIGKSTEKDIWDVHIRDSLELLPFIESSPVLHVIDIGSGGGLPAIPLAIFNPDKTFHLTEVDSKKLAFLEFAVKKLGLNARVEDINKTFLFKEESVITSRAFSEIANILLWAKEHTQKNKAFYLLKGKEETVKTELDKAGLKNAEVHPLDKGCIVVIPAN